MIAFVRSLPFLIPAGAGLAVAGVLSFQLWQKDRDLDTAQQDLDDALERNEEISLRLGRERANVDQLTVALENSETLLLAQSEAVEAAERAEREARNVAAASAEALRRAIRDESTTDETLASVLDYELPDSILRQLPE